ncbi:putative oxidoreductase C26H5.09c [Psilocybe cubensis]|uniref:Oxidoreductase C26H5.09c n=2 Tax=Psilocybe cubensis TaxID=181762 RepID=A0ACB8H529_PSICU|nr:putative oxidoreductase C26H5.09c [Psilocybe cubensis]KAH9482820.1 putative oxidoreductase C26H5.09c [Psilocybe cubensis]
MTPINTCVLGVGLSGLTFHVPFVLALPELFNLHSVLERNPSTEGGKVKERFGVTTKIHRSIDDVVADPEIELVIVGTPNDTHYAFAKAALNAGKHVLVDKPVTATFEEAKELGALAKAKGLVLYPYQNRRWDADFFALKKLLAEPEASPHSLGALTEFESHHDRFRKGLKGTWKDVPSPGVGLTYDLGSHLIDQTLCLFGRPDRITAFIQNLRGIGSPDVDDCFTIFMHYNAGARNPYPLTAILRSHILSVRSPQLRYVVRGTKGTYTKFGVDVQEDQLKVISSPKAILEGQYGMEPDYLWGTIERIEADDTTVTRSKWPSIDAGCYTDLFRNLGGAIRNGEELTIKWDEAAAVIEMIELAHTSSKEGITRNDGSFVTLVATMSLVDIRVDLPTHSRSFTVKVSPSSSVLDVKEEIYHTCPGAPRTSGQRLIWRGRMLEDDEKIENLWKTEPRIVHLAVHPSAWSSPPTATQPQPQAQPPPQPRSQPPPIPIVPIHYTLNPTSNPGTWRNTTQSSNIPSLPRNALNYVYYQHRKALAALSSQMPIPAFNLYEASNEARDLAIYAVERSGFIWPAILDEPYPRGSWNPGAEYEIRQIDGGLFLHLKDVRPPTPMQQHAFKVLSVTFTLLTASVSSPPMMRTVDALSSTSVAGAPHLNELLQQFGMPPLRAAMNGDHGYPGDFVVQRDDGIVFRQIPIRPLLAPLMMLILRTSLLLYFVAPARTPVFGALILAWMLYEIWQPIRNGIQNGWGRNPGAGLNQGQQQQNVNDAPGNVVPNAVPAPGGPGVLPAAANVPVRPGPVGPVTLDLQAGALLDNLANLNIEEEQRMLNQTEGAPAAEPGLGHKITTFVSLFLTTLHPAIWNRRRVALRRREGVVRTEANARSRDGEATAAEERREELRAQFNRRPAWIQRYMERVVAEEWVDDSD